MSNVNQMNETVTVSGINQPNTDGALTDYNVLETIRNEIQAEHSLVSHRMTWYVTSQAFLMTAYAVSFGQGQTGRGFFQFSIPLLGLLLSILAFFAVYSAVRVQRGVIKLQTKMLLGMIKELNLLAGKPDTVSDEEIDFAPSKEDTPAMKRLKIYARTTCLARDTKSRYHRLAMFMPPSIPVIFFINWVVALYFSIFIHG